MGHIIPAGTGSITTARVRLKPLVELQEEPEPEEAHFRPGREKPAPRLIRLQLAYKKSTRETGCFFCFGC